MSSRILSLGLTLTLAMTVSAMAGNKPERVGTTPTPGQQMKLDTATQDPSARSDVKGASAYAPGQENKPPATGAASTAPGKNK